MAYNALIQTINDIPDDVMVITFGDTFHPAPEIREALADKDVIAALQAKGVEVFIPEGPVMQNEFVRDYQSGALDYDQLRQKIDTPYNEQDAELAERYDKATTDLFANTADAFDVHYVDPDYVKLDADPEVVGLLNDMSASLQHMECSSVVGQAISKKYDKDVIERYEEFLEGRVSTDLNNEIAEAAIEIAGDRKIATLYGAGHMVGQQDLDEAFRAHGEVYAIEMYPDKQHEQDMGFVLAGSDEPDARYYIREDEAVTGFDSPSQINDLELAAIDGIGEFASLGGDWTVEDEVYLDELVDDGTNFPSPLDNAMLHADAIELFELPASMSHQDCVDDLSDGLKPFAPEEPEIIDVDQIMRDMKELMDSSVKEQGMELEPLSPNVPPNEALPAAPRGGIARS